ncbi:MAG TPA: hypothetical protein VGK19_11420 [Capsulimonadaceae bacterium]|jgi:hypothetical protein
MKTIAKRYKHGASEGVIRNADSFSRPAVQCRMFRTTMSETTGMKTMSVTGTMKAAVRRLVSAAVGLAVGAALLGGVLVAASGSARAGWNAVDEGTWDGTTKWSLIGPDYGPFNYEGAWTNPPVMPFVSYGEVAYGVRSHGKKTVQFVWKADYSGEKVPDFIVLRVSTSAIAHADIGWNTSMGEPTVFGAGAEAGKGAIADVPPGSVDPRVYFARSGQTKIIKLPANGGFVTYTSEELSSSVSVLNPNDTWCNIFVPFTCDVVPDNRTIKIKCPTKRKAVRHEIDDDPQSPVKSDSYGNLLYAPKDREPDDLTGDIGVETRYTEDSDPYKVTMGYSADTGNWYMNGLSYSWSSEGVLFGSSDTIWTDVLHVPTVIPGFSVTYEGASLFLCDLEQSATFTPGDTDKALTVSLSVTDGLNGYSGDPNLNPELPNRATASGEFIMNVHRAHEAKVASGPPNVVDFQAVEVEQVDVDDLQINESPKIRFESPWTLVADIGHAFEIVPPMMELTLAVAKTLGSAPSPYAWVPWAIESGLIALRSKEPIEHTVEFGYNNSGAPLAPGVPNGGIKPVTPDEQNKFLHVLHAFQWYQRSYVEIDSWNESGYVGQAFAPKSEMMNGCVTYIVSYDNFQTMPM